jgi:hypothetical protein
MQDCFASSILNLTKNLQKIKTHVTILPFNVTYIMKDRFLMIDQKSL